MAFKVTIYSDTDRFKGFLIEARTSADEEEAIGVWSTEVSHTKTINCFDSDDVSCLSKMILFTSSKFESLNFPACLFDLKSAVTHHYDDDYSDESRDENRDMFPTRDRRSMKDYEDSEYETNSYSEFEGYDPRKKSFSNVTFTWQAPSRWRKYDDKIVFV